MRIAVGREVDLVEDRVAATPETVKKLKALGADVVIEPGAGVKSGIPDTDYIAAGATVSDDAVKDADVVLRVRRPVAAELARYKKGALVVRPDGSLRQRGRAQDDGGCRDHRLRDGTDAAHHPRAIDGRAVEPGQSGGLPRGDRRQRRVRPGAADDDDGGRHGAGRESVHHGRRRRRPAGDRNRAPSRRDRDRNRRAAGRQGAGAEPRRQVHRGRGRRVQAGRDRRRLRQGNVEGVPGQAGRAGRRAHQEAGHRHHHGADSRPSGAAADFARKWWPRCGPAR